MLSSNISKCKEEINNLIQEEIKLSKNQIKPQFILLLDVSEKMEDFVEDFVSVSSTVTRYLFSPEKGDLESMKT